MSTHGDCPACGEFTLDTTQPCPLDTTDTEAAAVWERLTRAQRRCMLACVTHDSGQDAALALRPTAIRSPWYAYGSDRRPAENLVRHGCLAGSHGDYRPTDLGRRVAAHGRKVAP